MNHTEVDTKQVILEAAEAEFLEKGYGSAKMMSIAKRANVVHSMLHYYFKSKEYLFQTVFLNKIHTLVPVLDNIFEQQLTFPEIVQALMKSQFNSLAKNSNLSLFLLTEILTKEENRSMLAEVLSQKTVQPLNKLREMLEEEVEKRTIRPIEFQDFMLMIIAINASSFVAIPILQDIAGLKDGFLDDLLTERCESNVQLILEALKP